MEKFNFNLKKEEDLKNDSKENLSDEQVNKILEMSPKEVVDLMSSFESESQLEEFFNKASENELLAGMFSYWEKWLEKDTGKLLDKIIDQKKRLYEGEIVGTNELPLSLEKKFSEDELKFIFSNLAAIQLTFGCSKGCPFCGFDAIPGIRDHIPYSQLANLFQRYGKEIGNARPLLYWASEPSDYKDKTDTNEWTYQDVHQLASEYAGYKPHITSRNIENKEWINFLGAKSTNPRLSVLEGAEKAKEVKESAGNLKIQIMDIKHKGGLGLDIQDEKAQRKIKERGGSLIRGIGCKNGILITPRGIYNVINLRSSSNKFPQAMIISPISEIFDQEILLGDQVSKYMQNCVVQERYIFDNDGDRKFRREAVLLQKEIGYIVLVDNNGVIHKLEQFKMEDEIKRKKEERTTAEEKAKIAENIEKIFEDAVKDNKFTVHCYEQAIGGTEDIDNIKSMVLTTFANNEMYGPEGGKDTPVSFSWHGYSDDLTKTKEFIVNYNKESGAVFVDWDIRYKEDEVYAKYEDKRVDSDEEINKIVRKAVSDNKIHFMTNWTDEEKNKIANFLLDKEALLKLEFYNIADYGDKVLFGKDVVLEGMDKIRIIVKVNIKIKKAELYFE